MRVYSYANPLVVAASLGLLLWFAQLKIKVNKTVNWIAKSSFAVYLLHTNQCVFDPIFKTISLGVYNKFSGFAYLAVILVVLTIVFAAGILIDQPRKWLWKILSSIL